MILKLKEGNLDYLDLTPDHGYFVIGIEADDYRILNDFGKPYLYPSNLFEVVELQEPSCWITEYGEDGERYSYPPELNEHGFFEDYFDGEKRAHSQFWHVINSWLSELRLESGKAGKMKELLNTAAEIVKAQVASEMMPVEQIQRSLIETFSTLQEMQRSEETGHFMDIDATEGAVAAETQSAKKQPGQSIQNDKIVCLECGSEMRQLTTKHLASHNLSPREYKQKWGFSLKQPLASKSLTKARSKAAKKRGLPAELLKLLEERKQKKAEAASIYATEQKEVSPKVKSKPKARKTA